MSEAASLKRVCRDHMNEECKYGEKCRFIHDEHLCYDYWKSTCTAKKCRFNHFVKAAPVHREKQQNGGAGERGGSASNNKEKNREGGARQNNKDRKKDDDDEYSGSGRPVTAGGGGHRPKAIFETAKGGARGKRTGYGAKNTESFTPSHEPPTLRIVVDVAQDKISVPVQVRDITMHPCMFNKKGDDKIYDLLVKEMNSCSIPQDDLLRSWHGDSHWIANDRTGWKKQCPTFTMVVERLRTYFNMDIKATRFNWYKDQSEWKPYHHDAAAVKPEMARIQNFTVGVSFGCTREAAFEEVESKKVVAMPLPSGSVYTFARDVNVMWKHGILQVPPKEQKDEGRISIIAWGWIELEEVE